MPVINLLIPVIGTAAMVHVLDLALSAVDEPRRPRLQDRSVSAIDAANRNAIVVCVAPAMLGEGFRIQLGKMSCSNVANRTNHFRRHQASPMPQEQRP